MALLNLTTLQIIFLILTPTILIFLLVFFVIIPIKQYRIRKNFSEYCYKAIYKLAFDEDYYLINNFKFKAETKVATIDHILFAKKYFYIIIDTYYDGDLIGKENDKSLILVDKHGQKFYTENEFQVCKTLVDYLNAATGISKDLMIGIAIVNNECKIGVESKSKQYYIIQRNKFKKLIKAIESRDLGPINEQQVEEVVKAIDKLNRTKKK